MAETEKRNLPVAEEPEFSAEIPAIRPDDPVHFAQMNAMFESLLENDVFLKRLANKMIEKSLIAHVLDCENSQMVLGADQGPMITGLIDGVKEDVTQLYSDIGTNIESFSIPVSIQKQSAGSDKYIIGQHNAIPDGYAPILWCWATGSLSDSRGMQVSVVGVSLKGYAIILYAPYATASIIQGYIQVLCKKV